MFNHEPDGYSCPYCAFLNGKVSDHNNKNDIIAQNELAIAIMCPMSWRKNFGNVIVIPKKHYENIFSIPYKEMAAVFELAMHIAKTMRRTLGCTGITMLQRNEPDAGQHVWHIHVHVVPRYKDDKFEENKQTLFVDAKSRAPYAQKLRDFIVTHS